MALSPVESLRREESRLEKQLRSIQAELDRVQGALTLLSGKSATAKADGRKRRRKMSAATRAKMRASAKARWAKVSESKAKK
jgi:hypothetical protein